MIKVSVVLPTYNAEKYLHECVNSIVNQTLEDIEIIIVNDGSTDKTIDIAKKLQSIDKRIIIINQSNKGPGEARNVGLRTAKGEYISFIDPDDWIQKDMFLQMYNYAKSNNCDVVQCNYTTRSLKSYNNHNISTIPSYKLMDANDIKKHIKSSLLEGKLSTYVWDKIYKVSFLKENELYFEDKRLFEDWYFIMSITSKMKRFFYITDNFYNYRVVEGSLARKYYDNYEELIINLQKRKFEYMKLWGDGSDIYLSKVLNNLGDDILKIINHIFDSRYNLCKNVKMQKLKNLMNNEFLQSNFYNQQYITYIKESKINKFYLRLIFYCLKYKKVKLLYLLKSI